MAKYIAAKKRLEDKLEKRRHAREEEFRALGKRTIVCMYVCMYVCMHIPQVYILCIYVCPRH